MLIFVFFSRVLLNVFAFYVQFWAFLLIVLDSEHFWHIFCVLIFQTQILRLLFCKLFPSLQEVGGVMRSGVYQRYFYRLRKVIRRLYGDQKFSYRRWKVLHQEVRRGRKRLQCDQL